MTSSDRSGVLSRIAIVAVFLATWALTFSLATWVLSGKANAQSPSGDLKFDRGDLNFILKGIKISEEHVSRGGGCETLADILPHLSAPLGMRTVDGSCNNLIPGQENFGRADEVFKESLLRDFPDADNGTSYDSGMTVLDSSPRLISNLIVNQTTANPAAVIAAAEEDGTEIGADISGSNQFLIPNTAPDEGLSAPFNAYMTFFGQFFDHGLDLVNKGGNGMILMNVPTDDPLFDASPGAANVMMIPRATRMVGPDGVLGTNDDVADFINATTPHVDQQQTYASHAAVQVLLRHYTVQVTTTPGTPGTPDTPAPDVANIGDWMDGDIPGYNHAAPEGSNRVLVVMAHAEDNSPPGAVTDFTAVTYGGQPLTQVVEQRQHQTTAGGFSAIAEIWILDEAGIQAASGSNLVATTTGAPEARRISSLFFSGVDQADPTGQFGTDGENANNTQTLSVTVTGGELDAGDMVIANNTVRNDQGGDTSFAWANGFTPTGEYSPTPNSVGAFLTYSDAQTLANGGPESATVTIQNNGVGALSVVVLNHAAGTPGTPGTPPTITSSLQDTGRLLNGYGVDEAVDTADDGGMATWATMRTQATQKFGITLDDSDGENVPMIHANAYGDFIPGANGLPQLVTAIDGNGIPTLLEGNLATPVDASLALRVNQNLFIDVSHTANPAGKTADLDTTLNSRTDLLSGQVTRGIRADSPAGTYDDELLDRHFMCGDGRCNENIALTTIHHLFHSEHNRLVEVTKRVILDTGDLAFLNEWLDSPLVVLPAYTPPAGSASDASLANQAATLTAVNSLGLDWNGARLFQAARFGTEMQYNRVVFDEFVPTLSGLKDDFEGFHTNENPTITSEFAQSVYRFGHSMLTETVDRYDTDFNTITDAGAISPVGADEQLGLFEAFLNPLAWNNSDANGVPTLNPEEAAGSIIRGLTRATANQIDEFVTGGMQNNLVGLPLDIGAINIARGRDVGNPKLNAARKMFHAEVGTEQLLPYISWMDYGDNMRHEASLINFIAAYGTHPSIVAAGTTAGRRAAACAIVGQLTGDPATYCATHNWGAAATPADALDFLFSRNAWETPVGGAITTGVDDVDFWIGGLVEERQPFGGHLGSTHNHVFENQMERLQNGDRFYYVGRTKGTGMNFFNELESNSFTALAMRNSDLGEYGAGTLPLNIFSVANFYMEVDQTQQFNTDLGSADPEAESELFAFWIRDPELSTTNINVPDPALFLQTTGGDHYTVGGTPGNDTIIGGIGDDNLWGRAGNDRIEGGDGADLIEGGPGDDIITDLGGPDVIEGGPGNDVIFSGNEEDVVFGDEGDDFIVNSSEFLEGFGGEGNDWFLTGIHIDFIIAGPGDDWLENLGGGEDIHCLDNCRAPESGEPAVKGNDVYIAYGGNNDMDMENGDDIMIDGPGTERMEGQLGFDWASFQNNALGVNVDLDLTIFLRPTLPPSNDTVANRYDRVEGLSGSAHGDVLRGTPNDPFGSNGNELVNFGLIDGLEGLVPLAERRELPNDPITGEAQFGWTGGEIILGGGSSDLLIGEGGDDILDGDSSLATGILTPNPETRNGVLAQALAAAQAAVNGAAAAQTAAQITATASAALAAQDQAAAAPLNAAAAVAQNQANLLQAAAVAAVNVQIAAGQTAANAQAQATADAAAATAAQAAVAPAQAAADAAQAAAAPAQATAAAAQVIADAAAADATATAATAATAQAISDQAAADAAAAQADAIAALIGAFLGDNSFMDFMVAMDAATAAGDAAAVAAVTAATAQADAATAAATNNQAQAELAAANTAAATALVAVTTTAADLAAATQAVATTQATANASAAAVAPAVAAATQAQVVATAALAMANQAQDAAATAQALAAGGQAAAVASAAQAAVAQQALADASAALNTANADVVAAQAAMAAADEFIIVAGMQDIKNAVLAGTINPGELSISRIIGDDDELNADTDVALYSGNSDEYEVESDALGNISDENGDGFIQVLDTRDLIANVGADKNTNEGRDLVRNIERLAFADTTREVPAGVAGAANSGNSVAEGQPTISGTPEVDMTLTASLASVSDADNVTAVPVGSVDPAGADIIWEREEEPNSNFFSPIRRLAGIDANGDAIQVQGATMVPTTAEAGRRVRVTVIFQDEAGVIEIVTSAPVTIENCPGCAIPAELLADLPANFLGTAGDIDGDSTTFENRSVGGAARIEVNIPNVQLALFENTGFGDPIVVTDEIEVDSFLLTFTSITEGLTGGPFVPQIVAFEIVDGAENPTGVISQTAVDVQWDFLGADVAPLIRGLTAATVTVKGVEVRTQLFSGDSSVDPEGVVLMLTAEELAAAAALEVAVALGNEAIIAMAEASLESAIADAQVAAAAVAAAAAAEDTIRLPASSGNTDRRGRIRLDGTCEGGGRAQTTARGVRCSTEADGSYSCRGRGLAPFTQVVVTCEGGGAAASSTAAVVASSVADSRGSVRVTGSCSSGEASAAGLRCSTRRSGTFSCRGRGFAAGQEVGVTCQ